MSAEQARRRRERRLWERRRQAVACKWGITADQVAAILHALPYGALPDWDDVERVLDTLVDLGITAAPRYCHGQEAEAEALT